MQYIPKPMIIVVLLLRIAAVRLDNTENARLTNSRRYFATAVDPWQSYADSIAAAAVLVADSIVKLKKKKIRRFQWLSNEFST